MANLPPEAITVRIRGVYGNELIYPVCDKAKILANIAGTKTLTRQTLAYASQLGFDVHVEQQTLRRASPAPSKPAPEFKGYQQIIHEATGHTDVKTIERIEDLMRDVIFHSTLDWQTREQLMQAAREANDMLPLLSKRAA